MSKKAVYKIGQIIGDSGLPYLGDGEPRGVRKRRVAKTKCSLCGTYFEILIESLTGKNPTKSCGCLHRKISSEVNTRHGSSRRNMVERIYSRWIGMRDRCNNPNSPSYERYGGRGIFVCDEWDGSFEEFRGWAIRNGFKEHLQIDRIDNNDGYKPDNCRFVDAETNSRNKRVRRDSKWGVSGITFDKKSKKFRAEIGVGSGRSIVIARTSDFFEACCARKSAENRYWKDLC